MIEGERELVYVPKVLSAHSSFRIPFPFADAAAVCGELQRTLRLQRARDASVHATQCGVPARLGALNALRHQRGHRRVQRLRDRKAEHAEEAGPGLDLERSGCDTGTSPDSSEHPSTSQNAPQQPRQTFKRTSTLRTVARCETTFAHNKTALVRFGTAFVRSRAAFALAGPSGCCAPR